MDIGASNSWTPPPCFGDKKRRGDALLSHERNKEAHISFGAWDLMLKGYEMWRINSTWVGFKLVKSYSK